jgi:hypothetical protein
MSPEDFFNGFMANNKNKKRAAAQQGDGAVRCW